MVFQKKLLKTYREECSSKRKDLVFIVGDSKLTEKWKSEYLILTEKEAQKVPAPPSWRNVEDSDNDQPEPLVARGYYNVATERTLPLEQLSTYCRFAETRYFFLVTQDEVVVFRVRRIDKKELLSQASPADEKLYAAFEYKSIPWESNGANRLNFNLAVWALACMGMNDYHREMEGPGNTPLAGMARLTHWIEDKAKGEYTNVISGRVIKKDNWAKMKTDFVKLTTADGYSKTKDFYGANTGSLTTQMRAMSLASGQSSGSAPSGAPGPSTGRLTPPSSSSKAPQPQASTGRSPPRGPASTPAPPKPKTSPPGAPSSNRTGTSGPAGSPGPRGSPAGPSRSTTAASAPQAVTATFNKKKYAVTMKDGRPFSISVGTNDVRVIKRGADGKGYYIQDKGQPVPITLTK